MRKCECGVRNLDRWRLGIWSLNILWSLVIEHWSFRTAALVKKSHLGRVWDGLKVKKTQCLPALGRVGRVQGGIRKKETKHHAPNTREIPSSKS